MDKLFAKRMDEMVPSGIRKVKEKPLKSSIKEARPSRVAKKGSKGNPPCGVKGRSSLVGFGATPQLFFGRSTPRKPPTKVQAAKRPCQ